MLPSSKTFLLLDEVAPQHLGLPFSDKKDCYVKIQDLICYWDKVRIIVGNMSPFYLYIAHVLHPYSPQVRIESVAMQIVKP